MSNLKLTRGKNERFGLQSCDMNVVLVYPSKGDLNKRIDNGTKKIYDYVSQFLASSCKELASLIFRHAIDEVVITNKFNMVKTPDWH